jgi:4-amino-4-deoxy-L-arabinose transferase-like glycosyltransferase
MDLNYFKSLNLKKFNFKKFSFFLLLVVILLASFLRIWQIENIPPGLYPDEAINGNEAFFSLKNQSFQLFYPENNGREGLYINLLALIFYLIGPSIFAIRLTTAILGILTIICVYLLGKELFNEKIGLVSSALLSFSFWHINLSHLGFRAILTPLVLSLALYFLLRGLRTRKSYCLILSGFFWGLGFYTYTVFRLAYFLLLSIMIAYLFKNYKEKERFKFLFKSFLLLGIVAFIIMTPLLIYFIYYPEYFVSRATGVSVFGHPNVLKNFLNSLIQHLLMFNVRGDGNWRHHFSNLPMLNPLIGLFFLYGFYIALKNIKKDFKYLILVLWFFTMLLPGALTIEGIPHSLRVVGVIPAVFIISSLGIWEAIKNKKQKYLILIFILSFSFFYSFTLYFFVWAKNPNVKGAFTQKFVEIGKTLNSIPDSFSKVVVVNESGVPVPYPDGIPMPAQTPMFIEISQNKEVKSYYLKPEDLWKIPYLNRPIIIVPMQEQKEIFQRLEILFPNGKEEKINNITVYEVK